MYKLPNGCKRSGDEVEIPCPNTLCPKPDKFNFNTRKHVGHCFRCGYTIHNMEEAESVFGTESSLQMPRWEQKYTTSGALQVGQQLVPVTNDECQRAQQYLIERRVPKDLWHRIYFCIAEDSLYLAIYAVDGMQPVSWQRRNISDGGGWRTAPGTKKASYMFNWHPDLQINAVKSTSLILVEGPFDVLSPCSLNNTWDLYATAILGSTLYPTQCHAIVEAGYKKVIIYFDPDEAGRKGACQAAFSLQSWGITTQIWNGADEPGDLVGKPGEKELEKVLSFLL